MSKSITVETDAPGAERMVLRMSFEITTPIVVSPSPRLILTAIQGEEQTARVLLHRADGEPLKVEKIDVSDPKLLIPRSETVTKDGAGKDGAVAGDVWVEVSVRAGAEAVNRTDTIKVHTNHPELKVLELPLTLRIRSVIEATPSKVNLWYAEETPAGRSAIIRLRHNRNAAFEVRGVTTSHPSLFVAHNMSSEATSMHNIRVELAEGVDAESIKDQVNGSLRITTSEPSMPMIEVSVILSKRSFPSSIGSVRQVPAPPKPPQHEKPENH